MLILSQIFQNPIKFLQNQNYLMFKKQNRSSSKSQTGFILINGTTKQQSPLRWQWLTQRNLQSPEYHEHQTSQYPRQSYSEKKSILSNLQQKPRVFSSFKIKQGFSMRDTVKRTNSCSSSISSRVENKKMVPFVYVNCKDEQMSIPSINFGIDEEEMQRNIKTAKENNKQLLIIISVKRIGLRFKINHAFTQYCSCGRSAHNHDLKEISANIKHHMKEFNRIGKEIYYYTLQLQPIHNYQQIAQYQQNILFADFTPNLTFTPELHAKVINQVAKIQKIFDKYGDDLIKKKKKKVIAIESDKGVSQPLYDWQRIKDAKEYAYRLIEDPYNNKLQNIQQSKGQLLEWYQEKYHEEKAQTETTKDNDKNLLFQSKSHYPKQMKNPRLLDLARQKIQVLPTTNNRHKFIPQKIDLMMEHIKRQKQLHKNGGQKSIKGKDIQPPLSKKDMLFYLDKKNSLLTTQNIPYLIQKYGMNRFQIYNLYNLYKSFEKISLMRKTSKEHMQNVMEKGIDRQTFQVGLKGLDMIPGEQLIKNICHFGDFISWQQFIKIISISLRKTPEQKLTAILKGISSSQNEGFLSRHQISLMIGNSLHKLFDNEQPELKEYFTNMAMKQFDKENSGKVGISILKEKILGKGSQHLNMVSFLILNT